eukprot:2291363-Alexandrium_andersonii.AAC.1
MLGAHGYTAGCSKRNRVRERRPAAWVPPFGGMRGEVRALLRSIGDASVARADARVNEHLAQRAQASVKAAGAPVP